MVLYEVWRSVIVQTDGITLLSMPDFVASTTATVIDSFVGLFTTLIAYVVTDLWPYILGVAIVLFAYRKGRQLMRF